MDEAGVRDVLLARAIEEVDRDGRMLSSRARTNAAREARTRAGEDREVFLASRARALIAPLVLEQRAVARARAIAGRMALPGWVAFALAFALGLAVDRLASGRSIHVLSFPLLVLIAWNFAAYVFFFVAQLRRFGSSSIRSSSTGWIARAAGWLSSPARRWMSSRKAEDIGLLTSALERFIRDWARAGAPLHLARARAAVHFAAAGLALGVVCGMYLRGLVLEYRASWESTFLDAGEVHALLAFVLGPAARSLGTEVPDVAAIDAMRAPAGSGPAAIWIHLYSATTLVTILLPRLALAWLARRKARALSVELPIVWEEDPYFLRLFAHDRGAATRAEVTPYSFRLSARAADELSGLLLDLLGNRTQIELRAPLEYGAEAPGEREIPDEEQTHVCEVLAFHLGQSPEQEVHGKWIEGVKRAVEARGALARLLVVVDESRYAERLGGGAEAAERLDARRRSWQRVLRECGPDALFLDLERPLAPDILARAQDALWPRELAGARS